MPAAFAPDTRFPATRHALCNAHLLRELIAVTDHHSAHPSPGADTPAGWCWAAQVIDALLALKAITGTGALPDADTLAGHRRLIVSAALVGAAAAPPPPGTGRAPPRARPRGAGRPAGIAPWLAASPGASMLTCALPPTCRCRSTTTRP